MTTPRPWLYTGSVFHKRYGAAEHRFRYPALFLCFPLSARPVLDSGLMGYNRFNLFSFHEADHGDGRDAETWIRGVLQDAGLARVADGEVFLHTQPRILGFVFNPVSFWYCHDRDGALRVVLAEVNNTFGERHRYLLSAPGHGVIGPGTALQCRKVFHVSPFFAVEGEYRFRFTQAPGRRQVVIDYYVDGQRRLLTSVTGTPRPLNTADMLRAVAEQGWSTVLVVLRIHWQALLLWRKGAVFHRKPAAPDREITS